MIVLAITAFTTPARAHTELEVSDPAPGARLDRLPASIELGFSGPVDPDLATVVLTSPGDRSTGTKLATTAGAGSSVLRATVSSEQRTTARAGMWSLNYRVTSTDGHPIQGSVQFRVAPDRTGARSSRGDGATDRAEAEGSEQPPGAAPASEQTGSGATWLYAALGSLALVALAVAVTRRLGSRGAGRGRPRRGSAG